MPVAHCPICETPFGGRWITLAQRTLRDDPAPTHLCPQCTTAVTGRPRHGVEAGYRARLCAPTTDLVEGDLGEVRRAGPELQDAYVEERLGDLHQALESAPSPATARVLHVGSRDGRFIAAAQGRLGARFTALEPWIPWARRCAKTPCPVISTVLEQWTGAERFDVVVEHGLLPLLTDPVGHLRSMADRLAPGGVALIEVPNLTGAVGSSGQHLFALERPVWFTPRALVTACRRAGLAPFFLLTGERLRVLARPGASSGDIPPGPSAQDVSEVLQGNDLRLELKRALAHTGITPQSLAGAARVHGGCTRSSIRADLALEIANACQRAGDLEATASWLTLSLQDRKDPDVEVTLAQVIAVRRQIQRRNDEWAYGAQDHRLALAS